MGFNQACVEISSSHVVLCACMCSVFPLQVQRRCCHRHQHGLPQALQHVWGDGLCAAVAPGGGLRCESHSQLEQRVDATHWFCAYLCIPLCNVCGLSEASCDPAGTTQCAIDGGCHASGRALAALTSGSASTHCNALLGSFTVDASQPSRAFPPIMQQL